MWWLINVAVAATVTVNGVRADGLRNQTFENATVTIDAKGDITITAPGYKVEPVSPAPVATASEGRFWLVTEDQGSSGHVVEVFVNGKHVATVKSGDAQKLLDVTPWLHSGANSVRMESTSNGSSGGAMYVYVGSGRNEAGTVVIDKPEIQYGLGPDKNGTEVREYTLTVGS